MKNVKADIPSKMVAALELFTAKNYPRYYLAGIYVEPIRGGGVFMVATNGHAMMIVKEMDAYANRPFILGTRKDLVTACKYKERRRYKAEESVTRLLVVNGFTYAMKNWYEKDSERDLKKPSIKNPALAHAAFPLNEIEGKFPDWRKVLPSSELTEDFKERQAYTNVNPELVDLFRRAFVIAGVPSRHHGVRLTIQSPTKSIGVRPIWQEVKDSVFGVLMPMHGLDEGAPSWVGDERAKSHA